MDHSFFRVQGQNSIALLFFFSSHEELTSLMAFSTMAKSGLEGKGPNPLFICLQVVKGSFKVSFQPPLPLTDILRAMDGNFVSASHIYYPFPLFSFLLGGAVLVLKKYPDNVQIGWTCIQFERT